MLSESSPALESIKRFMSAINCGAALLDRGGIIVHVNDRLCAMMHRTCGELVGSAVIDLYRDEDGRGRVRDSLDHFDRDMEMEFFLPLPDGSKLPIISSARTLPGEPPLSDHRLVTIIDISKRKDAEKSTKEQYELIVQMSDTLLQQATELKRYSQRLEQRVQERTAEIHQAHMEALYMLAIASEAKDQDTGRHVRRIQRLSRELSRRVGFSDTEAESIGHAAILHDVGKIHVPDDILTKPGPLDDQERARMQLHTLAGERILSSNAALFERAKRIARSHHENWDGSGYPDATSKNDIPIESRIVHLADVFDALTHDRVYKKAWSEAEAADSIRRERGTMFDPEVVRAFESALEEHAFEPVDA